MKLIRRILFLIILAVIVIVGITVKKGYTLYKEALAETSMEEMAEKIKSIKNYTSIDEVPEIYTKALVAAEDHRFYLHHGIDVFSIARAIWNNIVSRKLIEGGSSITQQLAKNTYFTQERSILRKIAEVFMAAEYEKNFTKEEILEFYMNTCYYGEGCYTIKEASRTYFDKEPIEMNDYECVMLVGVPNAPSVYAPTVNMELAKERQLQVIRKMINYGTITEEKAQEILNERRVIYSEQIMRTEAFVRFYFIKILTKISVPICVLFLVKFNWPCRVTI